MKASEAAKHSNCIAYRRPGYFPEFFFRYSCNVLWFNTATQERYTADDLEKEFTSGKWEPWCRKEVEPDQETTDFSLHGRELVPYSKYAGWGIDREHLEKQIAEDSKQ